MKLNLDSHTVDIPCPGCGKKVAKTIGWLKTHPKFDCACGQPIAVDLSQFKQGLAGAQKSMDSIDAALRKIGKR
ncbi:hypothetical protein [Acidovorax sp.]|uniref:hypothetical protein n=1 Tax=Acidovorax sp. TaxID=1872122 RepID=UPI002584E202|nr:hypothetical protein [Acidovorax sp.]